MPMRANEGLLVNAHNDWGSQTNNNIGFEALYSKLCWTQRLKHAI
jgi:hypothetical protein